jgi:hypothetical protein
VPREIISREAARDYVDWYRHHDFAITWTTGKTKVCRGSWDRDAAFYAGDPGIEADQFAARLVTSNPVIVARASGKILVDLDDPD